MSEPSRRTFTMEFGPEKRVSVWLVGELDDEMIEALEAYIARHRMRLTGRAAAPQLPQDTEEVGHAT